MAHEWLELTPAETTHGSSIYVNFTNAISVRSHDKGSRITFVAGQEGKVIDVQEPPGDIFTRLTYRRDQKS